MYTGMILLKNTTSEECAERRCEQPRFSCFQSQKKRKFKKKFKKKTNKRSPIQRIKARLFSILNNTTMNLGVWTRQRSRAGLDG